MLMKGKLCSWLLSLCLIASSVATALTQSPNFKIFTTEQGLAHDSINRIVLDSRGFVWFCTAEGLSRYDGKHFTNFTQEQGLPHRNVSSLLEMRDGTILIGTNAGLVLFNPYGRAYRWNIVESRLEKDGDEPPMFETFEPPGTENNAQRQIFSLAQDRDGTVWVGTGAALYRVTRVGDKLNFDEFKITDGPITIAFILPDSRGGVIITSDHLYRIFAGEAKLVSDMSGYELLEDNDGRIWVGPGGDLVGIRIFEFNDQGDLAQTGNYSKSDGLVSDSHFRALLKTADGRIFVGGDLNGLSEFVPHARPGEPRFRSLARDYVSALGEDEAGNVWIGTDVKGAFELPKNGFESFGEKEGIPESSNITSIFVRSDGEIFLTVWPNILMHLNPNGKFESVIPSGVKTRSWGWNFLDLETAAGEWWIPAAYGLYHYPRVDRFEDLARTPPQKIFTTADGIWNNETFMIFEDSRGNVWISTFTRDGNTLARWDHATDKIVAYTTEEGLPKNNGAISFVEDRQGNIWFGHYFGSLVRYRDGRFRTFDARDGIPQTQIDDLHVDADGRLWIATTGRGLFRLDDTAAEIPSFTNVSTQNGLSSNQAVCIAEDKFKQIYVGTGHGIDRIDPDGTMRVFTQSDGLPSNYITRCAADKNGYLWFVSRTTLVRLKASVDDGAAAPPSFIDKIVVGGIPQKISALGETNVDLPELGPEQHKVQIDFFALTLGAGENVRYQYQLDDNNWSEPTEQQTVNLDLGPGDHTFAARAVRSDGAVSGSPATARMRILPPVWERWWFVTGSMVIVGLVLVGIYKYRTHHFLEINAALSEAALAEERLRKAGEERLAELEKVRSRIATDLHDDIGASLTQIAILSEVARTKSGASGSAEPLTKISDVSNELVEAMSDIVWSINPKKDHLTDLTQRMRRFAADVLSARGITFQFVAPEKDSETIVQSNLRREMFLIYKELISNVAKHSGAKKVTIDLELAAGNVMLEVTDNGNGFDASGLDPRETTDSQFALINPSSQGGNGLRNMFRRAREMGGEITIESEVGKGTRTVLTLPLESTTRVGNATEGKIV